MNLAAVKHPSGCAAPSSTCWWASETGVERPGSHWVLSISWWACAIRPRFASDSQTRLTSASGDLMVLRTRSFFGMISFSTIESALTLIDLADSYECFWSALSFAFENILWCQVGRSLINSGVNLL